MPPRPRTSDIKPAATEKATTKPGTKPVPDAATVKPGRDRLTYAQVKTVAGWDKAFDDKWARLAGIPATLSSEATNRHDGRLVKVVLVTVHDRAGRSRAGIPLQLLDDDGHVLDRAFTSRTGFAILTFPTLPVNGDGPVKVARSGSVRILDGTANGITKPVRIAEDPQFADLTFMLEELPNQPDTLDTVTATAAAAGLWPPPGLGEDPLTNLPSDFTPELCEAIAAKAGGEGDSLLGKLSDADDFRTRRTPLIKRLSTVRNGVERTGGETRRYLVRLRQEWVFLGYTLGELADVDALEPGAILDETIGTVERSVEDVTRLVDQARSFASSSLFDQLNQNNKIDTLVQASTSSEVNAYAGGFAIGIPGLFGAGGAGVGASMRTGATTSTSVDTSLSVNHSLSTAQTFVNEAVHNATRTLSSLARTVTSKLGVVNPLLSRVTNMLRWRVYENYAVCSRVEDVLELVSIPVLEIDADQHAVGGVVVNPVFSPLEIAEYRRFFEPTLLDPRLRTEYQSLVDAVRVGPEGRPVTHLTVEADYTANLATGRLVVEVNGAAAELRLRPGSGRAVGVIRFAQPVPASAVRNLEVRLSSTPDVKIPFFQEAFDQLFGVEVTSLSVWAGVEPGMPASARIDAGLRTDGDHPVATATFGITVAPVLVDATKNPLWTHVNQNPSYYLGVLAQSALLYPSLREDCDKLRSIPKNAWRLPIMGFEGNAIIVAKDPEESDDLTRLLNDPGAATLVQIAAPGAYGEALQGLLALADAAGLVHPSLLQEPPAQVPPLQIVDMTGRPVMPATSNGHGTTPSIPPTPVTAGTSGTPASAPPIIGIP
ncbi:MAG TPA: hypothetical protein VFQ85_02500 [Mycobacteriales bacterium]|jgi:hypothetical protein|nr:hypothetical protein [Mycobacteriales bacterium]